MSGFPEALTYVIENEGTSYTDSKNDRGGATKYGVTIPILSSYLGKPATAQDIQNLDYPTVSALYLKLFWAPLHCDELPYPIAAAIFDTAVNRGETIAVGIAQSCLVNVHADGILGSETVFALKLTDPKIFVYNYCRALLASYIELCLHAPSQLVYLHGWANRACRLFLLTDE